ncbi:DNA-directed RNA polymerase I subunit 2-like isoform X2 [Actinidia eriantha]|uniref:DNA-directed RNA polymerase I subunit 2-like isoform X2 n=1 Tax=Actinidia eriantha TaxID=165200 RepID=UPI00258CD89A|nr:DNA-directed RNA polymerase I subunit 2-like isoform X2 [Actinidia eriantha]
MKSKKQLQKASIRFRRSRNPVIGDKFSSRHGQKDVFSQLWSDIDMPFSGVTGMRPDLIINPHAFPSRMTIAMLLESIAAKFDPLEQWISLPGSLSKEETMAAVSVLEKWNEIPCLLMGLHIYCMTDCTHVLIITLLMCVPFVEASSRHQSSITKARAREIVGLPPGRAPQKVICTACQTSKGMETVAMAYVFRYLTAELAAMNVKMTLQLSNGAGA